jgi:hypothetical protein
MNQVVLLDREFRKYAALDGLLEVKDLSWGLPGGPKRAEMELAGKLENHLERVLDLLRFGVEVYCEHGEVIWGGYVHGVTLQKGVQRFTLSLDGYANRVAVRYESLSGRATWETAAAVSEFVEDSQGAAAFGQKEWIGHLPRATPAEALAAAASWLKEKGQFQKTIESGTIPEEKIIIDCRGWWETLAWKFYRQDGGFLGHLIEGKLESVFGRYSSAAKIGQKFLVPAGGLSTLEAWVRLGKTGEPLDQVVFEIVGDNGGVPGAVVLASGMVAGAELSGGLNWVGCVLSTAALAGGGVYWLVVRRSGALDANHYYGVQVDEGAGYANGELRGWNGSAWNLQAGDLGFAVLGGKETTEQIKLMAGVGGQYLNGVRVIDASGVQGRLWRPLERSCLEEITDLLNVGTASGKKLDAAVDGQRNLVIWERKGDPEWRMDENGKLWTLAGAEWGAWMDWIGGMAVTGWGECNL